MMRGWFISFWLLTSSSGLYAQAAGEPVVWELTDIHQVGGHPATMLGNPRLSNDRQDSSVYFDGIDDALVIGNIPVAGWKKFTIEICFKPDSDGPSDPRMVHFEDSLKNRCTLELRIKKGHWYFDGFLRNGRTARGVTLIDSTRLHATDRWQWAALVFDGQKMYTYINGRPELQASMQLNPFVDGNLSIGARLNRRNWFKGRIKKLIFHPQVLEPGSLQVP